MARPLKDFEASRRDDDRQSFPTADPTDPQESGRQAGVNKPPDDEL